MGQIQDLEQRISAAFVRISAGVEAMASGEVAVPEAGQGLVADLSAQLAEAQLQASETEAYLEQQVDTLTRHLDAQGLDVQRLSGTVAQLREDLRRLREAAMQGVVDPGLINKAMLAELDALRMTRIAEANEMTDILLALDPILQAEEARNHARA